MYFFFYCFFLRIELQLRSMLVTLARPEAQLSSEQKSRSDICWGCDLLLLEDDCRDVRERSRGGGSTLQPILFPKAWLKM